MLLSILIKGRWLPGITVRTLIYQFAYTPKLSDSWFGEPLCECDYNYIGTILKRPVLQHVDGTLQDVCILLLHSITEGAHSLHILTATLTLSELASLWGLPKQACSRVLSTSTPSRTSRLASLNPIVPASPYGIRGTCCSGVWASSMAGRQLQVSHLPHD